MSFLGCDLKDLEDKVLDSNVFTVHHCCQLCGHPFLMCVVVLCHYLLKKETQTSTSRKVFTVYHMVFVLWMGLYS